MATAEPAQGIGSEFHWMGLSAGDHFGWHSTAQFFARGRDTILALWEKLARPESRLWVPAFFCQDVIESWQGSGLDIATYLDHPSRTAPDWGTLRSSTHDLVLAVNFFGVRDAEEWTRWKHENPATVLVEDHTHDPTSSWATGSMTDFAIASLRKTMPVPDGAVLWSPTQRDVPQAQDYEPELHSSSLYLAAMILKRQYIQEGEERPDLRELYRHFEQTAAEVPMGQRPRALSTWGASTVVRGVSREQRTTRGANCRMLLDSLDVITMARAGAQPLFQEWPADHCPLNPVLVCPCRRTRDELRSRLIAARIYAPVHWPIERSPWPEVSQLSDRLLTIPLDFRCSDAHVRLVADQLNQFFHRFAYRVA